MHATCQQLNHHTLRSDCVDGDLDTAANALLLLLLLLLQAYL
jgi:hypothetical protein